MAGRPRIGTTKTVKLTLTDEYWELLDQYGASPSESVRLLLTLRLIDQSPEALLFKERKLAEYEEFKKSFYSTK